MSRVRKFFAAAFVVGAVVFVLIGVPWLGSVSSQQRAIDALNRIGEAAIERGGRWQRTPAFGFDWRGPRLVERFTGQRLFGNVVHVGFNEFDEQQLLESIPHLRQLPNLKQIGFGASPSSEVLSKIQTALPTVTIVGRNGKPLLGIAPKVDKSMERKGLVTEMTRPS